MSQKILFFIFLIFISLFAGFSCHLAQETEIKAWPWQWHQQTQPSFKNTQSFSRIAFGSCCDQKRPQPIWQAVTTNQPDLWIWLGDIVYADTQDMSSMKKSYQLLNQNPQYQKLKNLCPIIGVWDDHDYGANNAGKEYPPKKASQKNFLDFFEEPLESPRRLQQGVYASYLLGPPGKQIKVILLDVRYHRELPGKNAKTLGEKQWQWLEQELKESSAQIHLIASGIQVIARDHRFEKWANFPQERQRLFKLIAQHQVPGVIFLSGDRHIAEISKIKVKAVGYPIYEVTSSGLTHSYSNFTQETNRYREGKVYSGLNHGLIMIDWQADPVTLKLQVRDLHNKIALKKDLTLDQLQLSASD